MRWSAGFHQTCHAAFIVKGPIAKHREVARAIRTRMHRSLHTTHLSTGRRARPCKVRCQTPPAHESDRPQIIGRRRANDRQPAVRRPSAGRRPNRPAGPTSTPCRTRAAALPNRPPRRRSQGPLTGVEVAASATARPRGRTTRDRVKRSRCDPARCVSPQQRRRPSDRHRQAPSGPCRGHWTRPRRARRPRRRPTTVRDHRPSRPTPFRREDDRLDDDPVTPRRRHAGAAR